MILRTEGFESLVLICAVYLFLLLPHLRDVFNYFFKKKGSRVKPVYGWKLTIPSLAVGISIIAFHVLAHYGIVALGDASRVVYLIAFVAVVVLAFYYVITERPKRTPGGGGPAT